MTARAALALLLAAAACTGCRALGFDRPVPVPEPVPRLLPSGVVVEDLLPGTGAVASEGSRVKLHYLGRLADGTRFDSSYDRGVPLEFTLGAGQVVPGWEQGLIGMRVGGKRRITIPASQAYGSEGRGDLIPPDATLVLDVELLSVEAPGAEGAPKGG